jgi:hypothetical protein
VTVGNPLKLLSDDDLEAIRHLIRRDAATDLEIAAEAEKKLNHGGHGGTEKRSLGKTDKAREAVIYRYRKGAEYARWLRNWESRDVDLKKTLELQKQRFELLSNLVQDPAAGGMDAISKSLQARLLTLAAEASDEDLIEGAAKNGWIKNVIRVIQEQAKVDRRAAGEQAAEIAADSSLDKAEQQKRIREIFQ